MVTFYKANSIGNIAEDNEKLAEFKNMKSYDVPNIGEKIIIKRPYKIIERVFFVNDPNDEMDIEVFCKPCNLAEEWSD